VCVNVCVCTYFVLTQGAVPGEHDAGPSSSGCDGQGTHSQQKKKYSLERTHSQKYSQERLCIVSLRNKNLALRKQKLALSQEDHIGTRENTFSKVFSRETRDSKPSRASA